MSFVQRSKHICSQLLLGGLFYFYGFFTAEIWAGGWREGDVCGWCVRGWWIGPRPFLLLPLVLPTADPISKSSSQCRCSSGKLNFSFLGARQKKWWCFSCAQTPHAVAHSSEHVGRGMPKWCRPGQRGCMWDTDFWVIGRSKAQVALTFPCYANAEENRFLLRLCRAGNAKGDWRGALQPGSR